MIALELWTLDLISSSLVDTNGLSSLIASCSCRRDWLSDLWSTLYFEVSVSHPIPVLLPGFLRKATQDWFFPFPEFNTQFTTSSVAREALQRRNEDSGAQAHFQPYWPALPLRSGFWGVLINKHLSWGEGLCVLLTIMTVLTTAVELNPAMHVFSLVGRGWANASDGVVLLKYL